MLTSKDEPFVVGILPALQIAKLTCAEKRFSSGIHQLNACMYVGHAFCSRCQPAEMLQYKKEAMAHIG
ncbi:hypothetical protein, partial [Atopobium sp. oral taxon 810]|uniref:hypothetical protein n=1 Tax=Atopobium sp. oral taxon 810 TaxID=712158 RepID=UPI000397ED1E